MHPLMNIAINAARKAGDIIVRHMDKLDRIKVNQKKQHDYFSEVDIKAEHAIIQTIQKAYPDHGIIAEESGMHETNHDTVWLIDPLDGTTNYLHGFPFFSVSIAVMHRNRIEHALVFDPLRQECFTATRGAGAQLNDRRIRVSKQTQLTSALLGTGFPFRNKESAKKHFPTFEALFGQCAGVRRAGSAALDLAYVACGRLDGFWEFGLNSWDLAAGSLLIKEAGGLVSDFDGSERYLTTGNIVAGNAKLFKPLLTNLASTLKNNT